MSGVCRKKRDIVLPRLAKRKDNQFREKMGGRGRKRPNPFFSQKERKRPVAEKARSLSEVQKRVFHPISSSSGWSGHAEKKKKRSK